MIGDGQFGAQLAEVEKILKSLNLLEERQQFPNRTLGASHFRGMNYREIYEEMVRLYAYDFRLIDHSLLLCTKAGNNQTDGALSFSFYECPIQIMSYVEFVGDHLQCDPSDEEYGELIREFGDSLRSEYEIYANSLDAKAIVTPMRYDFLSRDYRAGVHPASHLHVGFENDIRIATRRIMNPISFVLLVLRQRYPANWEVLAKMRSFGRVSRNIREALTEVDGDYWGEQDQLELHLH